MRRPVVRRLAGGLPRQAGAARRRDRDAQRGYFGRPVPPGPADHFGGTAELCSNRRALWKRPGGVPSDRFPGWARSRSAALRSRAGWSLVPQRYFGNGDKSPVPSRRSPMPPRTPTKGMAAGRQVEEQKRRRLDRPRHAGNARGGPPWRSSALLLEGPEVDPIVDDAGVTLAALVPPGGVGVVAGIGGRAAGQERVRQGWVAVVLQRGSPAARPPSCSPPLQGAHQHVGPRFPRGRRPEHGV